MSRTATTALLIGILCAGFLSMGFQLVASRLLAPHFGSSLIVWAFLISTFLLAFSLGSFAGGWISRFEAARRRAAMRLLVVLGAGGFAVAAFAGRPLLRVVAAHVESVPAGLLVACPVLFLPPVLVLAALGPLVTDSLSRRSITAGHASGLVYGISTLGNIAGVMVTAFVLVPLFPVSRLLIAWVVVALVCLLFVADRLAAADRT